MDRKRNILIVKTGFSEFLDRGISTTVSLGDVLVCTAILHLYKNDRVTWLTAWGARHLLQGNPFIEELVIFGPQSWKKLSQERFDVLVNLEKDLGICTFLRRVKAKKRYGFYFDDRLHDITTHNRVCRYLLAGQENHRNIDKSFPEILYETVGQKWSGEGPVLGGKRKAGPRFDVGFNYSVGSKWPTKAWPEGQWKSLERLLEGRFRISWQRGHRNLATYIGWIDNCRLIVTSDSLGQALGLALGKKVVALYGPTNYKRMQGFAGIRILTSELTCPHMPCYLPFCKNDRFCMDHIPPEKVAAVCEEMLA